MAIFLLFSFIISLDITPPIIFDLSNHPMYPPPYYPYFYETTYESQHFLKMEFEKSENESIKSIEIYIRGKGTLPLGIEFSQFFFSTEKRYIKGEIPKGFDTLSENYKLLTKIKINKNSDVIVIPFTIVFKAEKDDGIVDNEPINLNLSFKINVK